MVIDGMLEDLRFLGRGEKKKFNTILLLMMRILAIILLQKRLLETFRLVDRLILFIGRLRSSDILSVKAIILSKLSIVRAQILLLLFSLAI